MGKDDWSNFDRPEPFCDKVWGGSRSRSSIPEPTKHHIRWPPFNKGFVIINYRSVKITEKQEQEINKMKLKQDAEMKKILREVDDDYVLKDDEEWVTEEDIKKMEEEFADALDDFIKQIVTIRK